MRIRLEATTCASAVLLTGERGTGLAAKTIHYNSDRAAKPFVNVTCSALPEQLLESELFDHERGAYNDTQQQKRGLFETADGGTVFPRSRPERPPRANPDSWEVLISLCEALPW